MAESESKDFFISYNKADRGWAEWIAWQLEAEGYTTVLQAWDFRPGSNFILQMNEATKQTKRTIAVLSPSYIVSSFTQPEWTSAFSQDPTGKQGKLLPVRVRDCELDGLLKQIVYIDLVGLDKIAAGNALRAGVHQSRALPALEPLYPGDAPSPLPSLPSFPGTWPAVWNIPYDRNPFFTGREHLLTHLHESLFATRSMALTQRRAISGLGGIGKTQTAIEYAYRYGQEYQVVLWVSAATEETFLTEFGQLATLLQLPERDTKEQAVIVQAVIKWLAEHRHWLLILDNADDLALVKAYLPGGYKTDGHLLLTTRTKYAAGIAQPLEVEIMDQEEGITLLLRRAGCITPDTSLELADPKDRTDAQAIVNVLGGLPLALDQAGAYIEETQCSLPTYLSLYQTHRKELLHLRSTLPSDHPESVATTWKLSFERVEQANPAAADLLRICAFLDPDAIPEDLFLKGASELGSALEGSSMDAFHLNAVIKELLTYSLVRRNADDQILSIHRLVQAVLKDEMDVPLRQRWAQRAICTVNIVFLYGQRLPTRLFLPHALACASLIDEYRFSFPEASHLLTCTGSYLQDTVRYEEAESLYQRALAIREKTLGPEHPDTSNSVDNLAMLYRSQWRYEEAEPLLLRTLAIREKTLGPEHPDTSTSLNNLALLYRSQRRYEEAEPLYQRALAIREKTLGPEHSDTGFTLNNLGGLYRFQERYEEAEPLLLRALAILEKTLGSEHPDIFFPLYNLGYLYRDQRRYEEAEPLLLRTLAIREKMWGPEHPDICFALNGLAHLYRFQERYEEAEPLLLQALTIREKALGPEHPDTGFALNGLAHLYRDQSRYEEAEPLYQRALAILEKTLGPEHPDADFTLNSLAQLYQEQGRYEKVEPLLLRTLAIREKTLGSDHSDTSITLDNLARLYQYQERYEEAEPLFLRSLAIKEKTLGPDHPNTSVALYNLARLYQNQKRYQEAEFLYQRVLSIDTKRFGPEHLEVAIDLESYAHLLQKMDRSDEAMQLQKRAQAIRDKQ